MAEVQISKQFSYLMRTDIKATNRQLLWLRNECAFSADTSKHVHRFPRLKMSRICIFGAGYPTVMVSNACKPDYSEVLLLRPG